MSFDDEIAAARQRQAAEARRQAEAVAAAEQREALSAADRRGASDLIQQTLPRFQALKLRDVVFSTRRESYRDLLGRRRFRDVSDMHRCWRLTSVSEMDSEGPYWRHVGDLLLRDDGAIVGGRPQQDSLVAPAGQRIFDAQYVPEYDHTVQAIRPWLAEALAAYS